MAKFFLMTFVVENLRSWYHLQPISLPCRRARCWTFLSFTLVCGRCGCSCCRCLLLLLLQGLYCLYCCCSSCCCICRTLSCLPHLLQKLLKRLLIHCCRFILPPPIATGTQQRVPSFPSAYSRSRPTNFLAPSGCRPRHQLGINHTSRQCHASASTAIQDWGFGSWPQGINSCPHWSSPLDGKSK